MTYDRKSVLFQATYSLPEYDPATQATLPSTSHSKRKAPSKISKDTVTTRTVHFDETNNQTYDDQHMCAEERVALWYSEFDIHAFRLQTTCAIRHLQAQGLSSPWNLAYEQLYQSCVEAKQRDPKISTTDCVLDDLTVGMEKRAVGTVVRDMLKRRKELSQEVHHWKHLAEYNTVLQGSMLGQASQKASRPLVLYAHYVAVASVAAEL